MAEEKIYFQQDNVTVTSSKVIMEDKNFVLGNISTVKFGIHQNARVAKIIGIILFVVGVGFGFITNWNDSGMAVAIVFSVIAAGLFLMKNKYCVQVSAGGHAIPYLISKTPETPQKVAEAINNALLDLNNNQEAEKSNEKSDGEPDKGEELRKFKKMLDEGLITQDEYDAKKKELLGL